MSYQISLIHVGVVQSGFEDSKNQNNFFNVDKNVVAYKGESPATYMKTHADRQNSSKLRKPYLSI